MNDRIFSTKLYLQAIKKTRSGGIAAAICIIVLNAIIPVISLIERSNMNPHSEIRIEVVSSNSFAPFGLLFILFAPLLVFLMFSYLNERSKSDFYHSIPQTRVCVYLSFISAVLSWITAIILATSTINTLLWMCVPHTVLQFTTVWASFINFFVLAVMMAGFMTLAIMITGTTVSNLLIFALTTLFARSVGTIFIFSVNETNSILLLEESFLRFLSFEGFLPFKLLIEMFEYDSLLASSGLLIYSFVVGIVFLTISGILYNKRRSEVAGQSAPNKILQTIYRSAITLPFLLILAFMLLAEGFESYQLIFLVIALVVHLLFELMTTKKVKNMLRSLKTFYIPVVATVLFVFGVFFTNNAINSIVPAANEITGITLIDYGRGGSTYENIQVGNIKINDERANEIVSKSLKMTADGTIWNQYGTEYMSMSIYSSSYAGETPRRMNVKISRKGKPDIARAIYMTEADYNQIGKYFTSSELYYEAYTKLPEEKEISYIDVSYNFITDLENNKLWNTFVSEYNDLSKEDKLKIKDYANTYIYSNVYHDIISLNVNGYHNSQSFYSRYPLFNELTPKTAALAAELFNEASLSPDLKTALADYYNQSKNLTQYNGVDYCNVSIIQQFGDMLAYTIPTNQYENGQLRIDIHNSVIKSLAESEKAFDFNDPTRKLYKVSLSMQISDYYYYIDVYATLTDEELENFVKKGLALENDTKYNEYVKYEETTQIAIED